MLASHSPTSNSPKILFNLSVHDEAKEDVLSDLDTKYETNDDAIRLGMLYVFSIIILANGKIVRIPQTYVKLVEDIQAFNDYPWGILACEMIRDSIRSVALYKVRGKRRGTGMRYTLIGFLHSLMVWAFENIPRIRESFSKALGEKIPRMLSWASIHSVIFGQVKQVLIGS